jgi:hypothetical protein
MYKAVPYRAGETNAYLVYKDRKKLAPDEYCHGDFKADLERGLLQLAREAIAKEAPAMETSPATRQSATAAPAGGDRGNRFSMPAAMAGHHLDCHPQNNRKCIMCGQLTKGVCGCGRPICGPTNGVCCWARHLNKVKDGTAEQDPMRWERGKRTRNS